MVGVLTFLMRTKRRKMVFFEGCLVGWEGVPTGAGLVDRGVDQGPWLQESRDWMAVSKKGEGWGLVGCAKEWQGVGGEAPRPEAPRP